MKKETGLCFLSGSCAVTDISCGQSCLGVSLEAELTSWELEGSRISVLESRRDAAPEEAVQAWHGAHQQHSGNLVVRECHSKVPGGALLPSQVWRGRPKRWPGWIWHTFRLACYPFPRVEREQMIRQQTARTAGRVSKEWTLHCQSWCRCRLSLGKGDKRWDTYGATQAGSTSVPVRKPPNWITAARTDSIRPPPALWQKKILNSKKISTLASWTSSLDAKPS